MGSISEGQVNQLEIWVPRVEGTGVLRQRGLGTFWMIRMCMVRELGIFQAEEIRGFLLRRFRSPTGMTIGVLRMRSFKSSQAEVFRVSKVKEIWCLCGCYF